MGAGERDGREQDLRDRKHRLRRSDGSERFVHVRGEVRRGEEDGPVRFLGTVHDITERETLEQRLEHRAYHDPLTELPNRALCS